MICIHIEKLKKENEQLVFDTFFVNHIHSVRAAASYHSLFFIYKNLTLRDFYNIFKTFLAWL